jgi:hypothetical protein
MQGIRRDICTQWTSALPGALQILAALEQFHIPSDPFVPATTEGEFESDRQETPVTECTCTNHNSRIESEGNFESVPRRANRPFSNYDRL